MTRVLVVDDSALFRAAFSALLEADPDLTVIGTAKNGKEAVRLVQTYRPDVVTMDVNMPVMNGYEAVEQIMALCPTPILMITGSPSKRERQAVLQALAVGALEVLPKPDLTRPQQAQVGELLRTIKLLARASVVRHVAWLRKRRHKRKEVQEQAARTRPRCVVAVAASTGGPAALASLLAQLPASIPAAIVVAQHITEGFTPALVDWFASVSSLKVRQAGPGHRLQAGLVLLAPSSHHMRVGRDGTVHLDPGPPIHGCRPSGDVLLTSVAEAFGPYAVGIVLTGMGQDGTEGLKAVRDRRGVTFAQDASTSVVFGMPKSAIEADVVDRVLPLDKIPRQILRVVAERTPPPPPPAHNGLLTDG